jgi:hypothetical protein
MMATNEDEKKEEEETEAKNKEEQIMENLSDIQKQLFDRLVAAKVTEKLAAEKLAMAHGSTTSTASSDVSSVVNCLPKSDSNDDSENVEDVVNSLGKIFHKVPPLKVLEKANLNLTDTPLGHTLLSTFGVQYRGIPQTDEGKAYWDSREYKVHSQVMSNRILFENTVGGCPKRKIHCDKPEDPLSKHVFLAENEVEHALGETKSVIVGLLYKKWPLSRELKYVTPIPSSSFEHKAFVAPCMQINAKTGKMEIQQNKGTKITCMCGAIFASIAKGKHEGGANDHLKLAQLVLFLPGLDDFRQKLHAIGENETKQSKELLCYHCRIFVMTYVSGANQSRFAIVGTDQRCSVLNDSQGCQQGLLPLAML